MTGETTVNDPGFDIATFGLTRVETGAPFALPHPATGKPWTHPGGKPVTVTLLSRYSPQFTDTMRTIQIKRQEVSTAFYVAHANTANPPPLPRPTQETLDAEDTELLVACTAGWSFTEMDGHPFPCTPVNARKFWTDRRFANWRAPAVGFFTGDHNFLAEGLISLNDMPAISSG